MEISPKYLMELIEKIEANIWKEFSSYKKVENYILKWAKPEHDWNGYLISGNFEIYYQAHNDERKIDLNKTLHNIKDSEFLLKIAADLGLDIPGFIATIPIIKARLYELNFPRVKEQFEKAIKDVYEKPSNAVSMANTALESLVKHILEDGDFKIENEKDTLKKLVGNIIREFKFRDKNLPDQMKGICSALVSLSQQVESLRSDKADGHGSFKTEYRIDDPIYAMLIVNSTVTVGLFLLDYYELKYKKSKVINIDDINIQMPF